MPRRLTLAAARRVAVAAQGLAAPRPSRIGPAALGRAIGRMGVLQLDSVNVFERSHYIPLWSRLGPYDKAVLDRLLHHDAGGATLGAYTEYTAHEATVLPVADWPLWAWHRARPERPRYEQWQRENASLLDEVRAEFAERGPARVRDLDHPDNVALGSGWWNKNRVHSAATALFRRGDLVVVGRRRFERVLAPASVLPVEARSDVAEADAVLELIRRAARAYGVATLDDLADYPRLSVSTAKAAVTRLEEAGELEPVVVAGWDRPAWLAAGTTVPRTTAAAAILSPFDPLIWYRPRVERLFGMRYRISIYTPAAQREHGYYVMPVLIDDELVGRVDLKSDRGAGALRVQHAHVEGHAARRAPQLATRLAPLLQEAASWQGLTGVTVSGAGTWAADVGRALS
ncbi:winged helix-turn-helix domain-containing protein [Tessaracoccus flavus]|uniref:Uncharacterized protein n=1 Tax=Tessaracoccus flavus TaxID=1610493 RepID=A0A1Q2CD65_9ACTN|nr:crosslink repair DNA glycosylase YcaQ family protein [Tessaracoccus flavus]AQP44036.1 hypothetical protein RPIT_03745 [Tessaracoccus flavus]SDY32822.1 hypothetical protein SAMN05428934_101351 [Tessaracoccus flavus]